MIKICENYLWTTKYMCTTYFFIETILKTYFVHFMQHFLYLKPGMKMCKLHGFIPSFKYRKYCIKWTKYICKMFSISCTHIFSVQK